jgi:hypothetical protein
MRAKCPKCQQLVEFTATDAPQVLKCPGCQQAFRAPAKAAGTAAASVAKKTATPQPAPPAATAKLVSPLAPQQAPSPAVNSFDFLGGPPPQPAGTSTATPFPPSPTSTFPVSVPRPRPKPQGIRLSNRQLLTLIIGVPLVLIAICSGIGYFGIQAGKQQEAYERKLAGDSREFAYGEAVKKLKPGEYLPADYMISRNRATGRFLIEGVIVEWADSEVAGYYRYNAEVSFNESTGKWFSHKVTVNPSGTATK